MYSTSDLTPLDTLSDRRKMQYSKSISLGNVITVLSVVGGLITVYSQFKSDIAVVQVTIIQQREVDRQHEAALLQLRTEFRDDVKDIKSDQRRISDNIERLTNTSDRQGKQR